MYDAYDKRDLACKANYFEKQLKELEKGKNLALKQHVEAQKVTEGIMSYAKEDEKKWYENQHDLGKALKEAEMLKANLKKMKAYVDEQFSINMLACPKDVKASVARGENLFAIAFIEVELIDSQEVIEAPELSIGGDYIDVAPL